MNRRGTPDAYYKRAKQEGFAARSVYKLQDMDQRYRLLAPGQRILDLGCHPGSWLQYAAQKVGPGGYVLGVDLNPPTVSVPGWVEFRQGNVLELTPGDLDPQGLGFQAVLSDLAPKTSGIRHADEARSYDLTRQAVDLAMALLKPGGVLLAKVFFGPDVEKLIARVKAGFQLGKAHKPPASRSASKEIYLLGKGFKGPVPEKE